MGNTPTALPGLASDGRVVSRDAGLLAYLSCSRREGLVMGDWTGGKGWGERSQHVSADKEKVYPQGLDTIGALALCAATH